MKTFKENGGGGLVGSSFPSDSVLNQYPHRDPMGFVKKEVVCLGKPVTLNMYDY